jgi:hypothetical protein
MFSGLSFLKFAPRLRPVQAHLGSQGWWWCGELLEAILRRGYTMRENAYFPFSDGWIFAFRGVFPSFHRSIVFQVDWPVAESLNT